MSKVNVLDASAILAYLQKESGEDVVDAAFAAAPSWVTAVNYCEVLSKLCEKGATIADAQTITDALGMTVIDFDTVLARHAAAMRPKTVSIGASFGDRACLSLAERTFSTADTPIVYTAEQSWSKIAWPFKLVVIRSPKKTK